MLKSLLKDHPFILAECAIAERLRRKPGVELDPLLYNAPLIYGPDHARNAMTSIYREYIDTAASAGLPLLITAPTWRVDSVRITEASAKNSINTDAVNYMLDLRNSDKDGSRVLIGALVGPKNDCYSPDLSPTVEGSQAFHSTQIKELATSDADYLHAQTIPSVREALGIARAMAETGKDYIISFCVGADGNVLDGTALNEAFEIIDNDSQLKYPPTGYYVNCTHPQFLLDSYKTDTLERLTGIQANGSSKDVRLLDGAEKTEADPISHWAEAMHQLRQQQGIQIMGGCCGTTTEHMKAIISQLPKQ